MKLTKLLIVFDCGLFAGCMVGPNYHRPLVQTPPTYRDLQANTQLQSQAASYADLPWWQVFQDPKLQELIRTALKQNYDLQLATERINAARAQLAITRSNLFPQVQGNGNFAGGKESNFQTKYNFLTLRQTPPSSWISSGVCVARTKRHVPSSSRLRPRGKRLYYPR